VPAQSALPPLTVAPGGAVRLGPGGDAPLRATIDPERPQVALFAADARTPLDVLFLAALAPGEGYGRSACGEQLGRL
jgi:spore coat protein H